MLAALLLDQWLGEARRYHPLVGFGRWVKWLEKIFYPTGQPSPVKLFFAGLCAWLLAVLPVVFLSALLVSTIPYALTGFTGAIAVWIVNVVIIYIAIGGRSLEQHAQAVCDPLQRGDIHQARLALSMLVSRDTSNLNSNEISTATTESVLENSHDSVIGVLVWFLLLGAPGVVLFRLANTLDAMWGYRSARYIFFGRSAARADDVLGFIGARVTVLLFALQSPKALTAAWQFGRSWYSPNAGPVMAAGAGALGVSLGGNAQYGGEYKVRPVLGAGLAPTAQSLQPCLQLVKRSYFLLPLLLLLVAAVQLAVVLAVNGVPA